MGIYICIGIYLSDKQMYDYTFMPHSPPAPKQGRC